MFQKLMITAAVIVVSTITIPANADLVEFQIKWDGASFGNTAKAVGKIMIDDLLLPNPGDYFGSISGSAFSNLEITITGASTGNGTYSFANGDFDDFIIWETTSVLDLTQELVGQTGFVDFNVFGNPGTDAPAGTDFFSIATSEGFGDELQMTSFIAVPEPSSLTLLCLVGCSILLSRRKRKFG